MKSILVVYDNEPDLASLVREVLKRAGEIVTQVENSQKAWKLLETEATYDVIVAGGPKGADLLIKASLDRNIRLSRRVLLSGNDMSELAAKIGARFLGNPFSNEELLKAIR